MGIADRQFIPYTVNASIGPAGARFCGQCKVTLAPDNHNHFCRVCDAMLEAVLDRPYMVRLHRDWVNEQVRLPNNPDLGIIGGNLHDPNPKD